MPGPSFLYFDGGHLADEPGADGQGAVILHGVECVLDERGPDLVEFAAVGADRRKGGIELQHDVDVRRVRERNMARVASMDWGRSTS